jgi:hypothetical protein
MEHSKKRLKDIKTALEKEHGRPISDAEGEKVADFLQTMAKLQVEVMLEDHERHERLKKSPGGFHLEKEGYTCRICQGSASGMNSWFDAYGLKCTRCQAAINRNIIPPSVATDRDSWYTAYQLERQFGLTATIRRQLIKKRKLIARLLPRSEKRPEMELFLLSDNPTLFPPVIENTQPPHSPPPNLG